MNQTAPPGMYTIMKRKPKGPIDEKNIDFSYEGRPPQRNFLSYRDMFIEMSKWAPTGGGWGAVVGMLASFFICLAGLTLFMWLITNVR